MSVATATLLPDPPRRRHEEADLARSVHQYLRWALPPDALHFAIPNGLMRSRKAAQRAQGEGVLAGVPDLCVIYHGRAIFIELKTPRGRLSAAQRGLHAKLESCGALVWVCHAPEEVETVLRGSNVRLRATARGWLNGGGVG